MTIFLIEFLILCVLFTLIVVPSVARHPLAWVSDYPPAIQQRARELGLIPAEQKGRSPGFLARKAVATALVVVLLTAVLVGINGAETFAQGFALSYALWVGVAWYDALVIDCLWFCHSKSIRIPGTEDLVESYHDYGFHLRMSCVGMGIGLPVCLLTGLCVQAAQALLAGI